MHHRDDSPQNVTPVASTTECNATLPPGTAGAWIRLGEKYPEQGVRDESVVVKEVCIGCFV